MALVAVLTMLQAAFADAVFAQAIQLADTNQYVNKQPMDSLFPWAVRPVWGINPNEFHLGAYIGTHASDGSLDSIWDFADAYNLHTLELRAALEYGAEIDTLLDAARPRTTNGWDQRVIFATNPLDEIGWAREVLLFPFDSVQSYYYQCKFLAPTTRPGRDAYNTVSLDNVRDAWSHERVYDTDSTTPGATIAEHLVWDYHPATHIHSWPCTGACQDSVENHSGFYDRNDLDHLSYNAAKMFVVVNGHLFSNLLGGKGVDVDLDSVLLEVDIINEIPTGTTYRVSGNSKVTAAHDTSFVYTTLQVRKSDLQPTGVGPTYIYDAYRTVALPVDMKGTNNGGLSGPFNDTNSAHRFDVRIRWTGQEKLALRNIALRDTMAQLLLGGDAASATFRHRMEDTVRRILMGQVFYTADSNNLAVTGPIITDRLRKLIRIYTGDEGSSTRNVGFSWLDSVLFRTYRNFDANTAFRGDDQTRGFRAFRAQSGSDANTMSSQNEQMVETHYNDYGQSPNPWGDSAGRVYGNFQTFGVALNQVPAIAEHNGGKFFVPELKLTRTGVSDATNLLQRSRIGAYITGIALWPYQYGDCYTIGHAAVIARRTGRRIINYAGVHARQSVIWLPADTIARPWPLPDSVALAPVALFGRITDANEIRQNINLAIAFGAQGIHYSFLGNNLNEFGTTNVAIVPGEYHYNYSADWGPIGPTYSDAAINVLTPMQLTTPGWFAHQETLTIDTCYVGWKNRMSEIDWIDNTWIPGLAPTLLRLHWRDAYSIHFTTTQLYSERYRNETAQMRERPLPTNEVVTAIESYGRDDTLAFTQGDAPTETYVELGLFDTMGEPTGGTPDPWKDTTFCYVVNRRTFERSLEIDSTSARGKAMDSLAEWRRVMVHLNIPRRDTSHYTFVRVREVFPDQTHLPFSSAPRERLDTAVANDSAIALIMRPGSGTLLEITYLKPDSDLDGLLAFNNGKKIIFDGTRYFATYSRFEYDSNYISSVNDNIYFRWSFPVSSPQEQIVWNPIEYVVSDPNAAGDTRRLENRTPSLTVRTINGDTIVTVVWTAHSIDSAAAANNKREIVARDIVVVDPDGGGTHFYEGPIQPIAYYRGSNFGLYGVPTTSCLSGGEMFVWSDSAQGICAAFRTRLFVGAGWWQQPGGQSATEYLNDPYTNPAKSTARFPSMAPFAHIEAHDSSIGITWEQDAGGNGTITGKNHIWYARISHVGKSQGIPTLSSNWNSYPIRITDLPGNYHHPSIDQWQCWWGALYEGIVYEDNNPDRPGIVYRPLHSDTIHSMTFGTHLTTYRWTPLIIQIADNTGETWKQGYMWPSIASLNEVINAEAANDTTFFAVAYEDSAYDAANPGDYFHKFRQAQIWFGNSVAKSGFPKEFLYNGYFPSTSSSPVRQELHAATLYQSKPYLKGKPIPTRTTRQFFGKARPTGYIAKGREATIRIDDSTSTGMSLRLNDVWIAGDSSPQGLAFVDRGSPSDTLDTLSQLNDVLRTDYFHAHDSVTIGCNIVARFTGDSALADTFWVDAVIELIDSANPSTGAIVLDSFRVSASLDSHVVYAEPTLDLVSGTYQIQMRLTTNVPAPATPDGQSVYPIGDIIMSVDDPPGAGKIRRVERSGGARARLSLQPNPVVDYTEIRFSIPAEGRVTVRVINQRGEEVAVPIRRTPMETGRYAVGVDTRGMQPGVYVVELTAGKERVVEKMVIAR
jgi:hypothetical protein